MAHSVVALGEGARLIQRHHEDQDAGSDNNGAETLRSRHTSLPFSSRRFPRSIERIRGTKGRLVWRNDESMELRNDGHRGRSGPFGLVASSFFFISHRVSVLIARFFFFEVNT
jgi:hypothetical protein